MKALLQGLLLFLGALIIEESVLPFLLPGNPSFRLVTLLVIGYAIRRGPIVGAIVGFMAGVVLALTSTEPLGVASFSLSIVGYAAGEASNRFYVVPLIGRIALVVGLLLLEILITFFITWLLFGTAYSFIWRDIVLAALVAPLFFRILEPVLSPTDPGEAR